MQDRFKYQPDRAKPAHVERARLAAMLREAGDLGYANDYVRLLNLDSDLFSVTDTPEPGEHEVEWRT